MGRHRALVIPGKATIPLYTFKFMNEKDYDISLLVRRCHV